MSVSLQHRFEYYALKAMLGVLRRMPLNAARTFAEWVGLLGYWPLGIRRRVVVRQIAACFPSFTPAQVRRVARDAYRNLARMTVEVPLVAARGREAFLAMFESTEEFRPVQREYEAGKGVILVSGHFGNWELAGAYSPMVGIPTDVIVRRQSNLLVDRWVNETRAALGMTPVHDAEAVRRIPRALREGRAVGLVADQGVLGLASTFVPFFGRPAKTPRGPAVFAIRYGLPLWFLSAVRKPSGKYHLLVREIPVAKSGDREADVDQTVANFTQVLEQCVREYPEQYFWHHRRWRRQPPGTPPELQEPK